MTDPTVCYQQRFDVQFGSFGGDASGTAWSVLCHRLRQAMVIAMPAAFQHAIQRALWHKTIHFVVFSFQLLNTMSWFM